MHGLTRKGAEFLEKVAEGNFRNNDLSNFWGKVKIDISCQLANEIDGWSKMQGNAETITKIFHHLQNNLDFGLKNPDGGYVYFIGVDIMLSWHPTDKSLRSVTKIVPEAFGSALKLAILGHPEFVSNDALQFNKVYLSISKSL